MGAVDPVRSSQSAILAADCYVACHGFAVLFAHEESYTTLGHAPSLSTTG